MGSVETQFDALWHGPAGLLAAEIGQGKSAIAGYSARATHSSSEPRHAIVGAGSAEKVTLLTDELGADRAINRHDGAAVDLLREAAPDGIDLYYDNVGGEQLEAALEVLNFGGRVVICGAVSNGPGSGAPANYRRLIYQELTLRGFTVTAHEDLRAQFETEVGGWLSEGAVRSIHTVFKGIGRVPEAFESLLTGGSIGRVLVSVPTTD